jgi:S1-C subfamily serine protease
VIVEINRQPVRTVEDMKTQVDKQTPGAPLLLLVNRDGSALFVAL